MRLRTIGSTILSGLTLGALLICTGGATALAQRFQYEYGGGSPEAGRNGVRALRDGGYIAVGETFSGSSGNSDIYLVRTNGDGSLAWSRNYDLGGNDSATDIEEVLLNDEGGFIITGVVENAKGCERMRDAFLLRIDKCGKVIWFDTYGTKETDEIGWDVIEMQNPASDCDGWQGDFVVAGSTAFPGAPLEGYLFRVHDIPPGNLVWTRTFNGPCDGDDYFYGVTEAVTGVDGNKGDIIAVGGSNTYSNCGQGFGGIDALIVRTDGCGKINAAPQGVAIYGGPYDDDLRSVIEVSMNCPGNIIATGRTEIDDAGVVAPEVYVVETKADPCNKVNDVALGDGKDQWDEGYDVHEVPDGHPDAGYVVVTGYMTLPGGLGGRDVFLQRFKPCGLGIVGPVTMLYGGGGTDWGWSIAPVREDRPCFSPGYVIAGFTDSFSGEQQLYLIKTDATLKSGCNETEAEAAVRENVREWRCVEWKIEERGDECVPSYRIECPKWQTQLCYDPDKTEICFAPECECPEGFGKNNLSGSTPEITGSLNLYPNPIKRGSVLNLECNLVREGKATVVVSDLTGKTVYTHSGTYAAGVSNLPVKTDGWSIGTYMVTVTAGGASQTSRVVVTDK